MLFAVGSAGTEWSIRKIGPPAHHLESRARQQRVDVFGRELTVAKTYDVGGANVVASFVERLIVNLHVHSPPCVINDVRDAVGGFLARDRMTKDRSVVTPPPCSR